jgi:hypothetical protein
MSTVAVRRDPTRTSGRRTGELRYALVRLVPSAVLVWAIICGLGYLLTRPLRGTWFELWDISHRFSPTIAVPRAGYWATFTGDLR